MAKRHTFKKVKPGEPIPVTARQLESFMLEHNGSYRSATLSNAQYAATI